MPPTSLRETVLRAAVDYVAEHGPDGLSFRQVAAAAGVSHQAPYHHFTDRQGIFRAIAVEGFAAFADALRAAEQTADPDPTVAMLEAYVDFALSHRGHFRVMFRPDLIGIADDPKLQEIGDESFAILVAHVQHLLGPDASVADIRARASAMWALAHGLAVLLIDGSLEVKLGTVTDRRELVRAVAAQTLLTRPREERP
ncbi:MAG: TetR/AcrR family transcriptional regulator [Actinomycetota bacterium]